MEVHNLWMPVVWVGSESGRVDCMQVGATRGVWFAAEIKGG